MLVMKKSPTDNTASRSYSMAPNYICAAVSFIGLTVSFYALYVEYNLESDINYQPVCDIASYVSCSKAFRSQFAEGLGVAPSILGTDHILTQFPSRRFFRPRLAKVEILNTVL
ncbi:unnamed protein product [Acanthocheilonema viteae]|uniref:vitamin-K-epoxide reductase (warfarin-sensitive) n=1 Tax=Acanthocheilonema viteae TaxID=6277 RepID=A0A498S4E2_ACAVI|nr:unnamed protein product [Acanthocheilonema viteae]